MTTKVTNLTTGEEQFYSCDAKQAVISAYCLDNNLSTSLALNKLPNLPIFESEKTVACGDWCSIK